MNRVLLTVMLFLVLVTTSFAQSIQITGKVVDAISNDNLEFVNLRLKNSKEATMTDVNGNFTFNANQLPDSLIVTYIGYKSVRLLIKEKPKRKLILVLEENTLSLNELTIASYKDPGKHIMQMVIENKFKNDLKRFDNNVFNEYRKTEIDVFKLDSGSNNGFFENIATIYKGFSKDSNSNFAPIYFTEKFFRTYHSNKLQTNIEHLVAIKQLGLATDKLGSKLDKFEFKINIYDANISILKTSFLSPVSALGLIYYKFIPIDTVIDGTKKYIKIELKPKISNENTFTGFIWVEFYTYAITKFQLQTNKGSNINFIDNIQISEDFVSVSKNIEPEKNIWIPNNYNTIIEFNNGLDLIGIPVKENSKAKKVKMLNSSVYSDFIVNSEILNANNFYNNITKDSLGVPEYFNDTFRTEKLSVKEQSIYHVFDSLKNNKKFVRETKLTTLAATGYWDFGRNLRVGPYSSLASTNLVEGLRIRTGFWTLPGVSKTFNFNGYMAYGFKDKATKGGIGIKYVPIAKRYSKTELFFRKDYDLLLDFDDALDADNLFTLALRKNIPVYQVFTQQLKLLQEIDLNHNWSAKTSLSIRALNPTFAYRYYKLNNQDSIVDYTPLKKLNVNEFNISFRYAHNERTTIFNYDKIRISTKYPVFTFNYTYGFELTKNSYFEYHKFVANLTQEYNLPIKGSIFYSLSGGQMFGTVPALLLFAPTGNAYYVSNKYVFNNMLPYEFAADRFASLMLRFNMGGLILNKIPILNKFNLRERFILNNYMGVMTNANRKFNNINPIKTTEMKPYTEAGIGIGNIFNVLSLDAIWRLSQLNSSKPLTRFGIYTTISLVF